MTKTHAELFPCPHCGESPEYDREKHTCIVTGEIEISDTIYCSNPDCDSTNSVEGWNTRHNKHAEFLGLLKVFLSRKEMDAASEISQFNKGLRYAYLDVLCEIEKFEAEQKQVVDDNR